MIRPAPAGESVRLISLEEEARLFFRLRIALVWQAVRSMLTGSRLRVSLVIILSGLFWGALYGLFHEAFSFLDVLHADVIPLLFNAFFSSLMVMLVFSAGILLYGGLYCSPESRLLRTLPVRAETVFSHKFREAMWFSSWGFVLLGSPMLVAYGVVRDAAWPYYALLLPFMLAFVVIPAACGGICCMLLVGWLPRLRLHLLTAAVTLACLATLWFGWTLLTEPKADAMSAAWFERAFARLRITEQKLLPSWWLASGLLEAARTERTGKIEAVALAESVKFLSLLIANALLLQVVAGWVARVAYRRGASHLVGEVPARRRRKTGWFDRLLEGSTASPSRPLRLLLVKDLRVFRRDISQWSQFLIFFGLLGLYFVNLRSFNYHNTYASMIGFLNLAVVGLILSTFTTRFVYPMISLEGRRFWILGLLPVERDHIVWSKFLFSFVGGVVPCSLLVLLSDCMLGIPWTLIAIHEFCCLLLCAGLSGIAVGLGARIPDLRESSPAKISSGFGGTLCLVLSSLYIMLVVITAAIPSHLFLLSRTLGPALVARDGLMATAGGPWGTVGSLVIVGVAGLAATVIPMSLGLHAFRRLEG